MKAAERGTSLRGIELRFYDPRGIIAAFALDPSYADVSCKDLFQHLLRTITLARRAAKHPMRSRVFSSLVIPRNKRVRLLCTPRFAPREMF